MTGVRAEHGQECGDAQSAHLSVSIDSAPVVTRWGFRCPGQRRSKGHAGNVKSCCAIYDDRGTPSGCQATISSETDRPLPSAPAEELGGHRPGTGRRTWSLETLAVEVSVGGPPIPERGDDSAGAVPNHPCNSPGGSAKHCPDDPPAPRLGADGLSSPGWTVSRIWSVCAASRRATPRDIAMPWHDDCLRRGRPADMPGDNCCRAGPRSGGRPGLARASPCGHFFRSSPSSSFADVPGLVTPKTDAGSRTKHRSCSSRPRSLPGSDTTASNRRSRQPPWTPKSAVP